MLNKKSLSLTVILILIISMVFTSCTSNAAIDYEIANNDVVTDTTQESNMDVELPDNDMDPDYETVFNQNEVIEFNIVIESDDWSLMQEDLAANISTGRDKGMSTETSDYEPIWVESSVTVNGITWDHVGIRYKGNSSLTSAVSSGNNKLSFKLDFDEFEEEYPDTEDQRFYGFKQLNLNNNFSDSSLMREKVAADLFRSFDITASQTTFAIVSVDYGEGAQYFGVYTLVEEMDDTGILSQFTDDTGNLYKPDGDAAAFSEGSFDESEMEKKTNEDEADYSDVEALYDIINSDLRISDVEAWQAALESVFDVDEFLKYLAVNNVIQNWDTYGNMTHNFYLYNDPESGLLTWIPWDNNEAFTSGKGNKSALSLSSDEVGDNWPIISYILDIEEYKTSYNNYLQAFIDDVFTVENMTEIYESNYELIKAYAYAEESGYTFIKSDSDFDNAVETLIQHVQDRNEAVEDYLNN